VEKNKESKAMAVEKREQNLTRQHMNERDINGGEGEGRTLP